MRVLIGLGILVGGYFYFLMQVTNTALGQVQQLNHAYQSVAAQAEQIAGDQ